LCINNSPFKKESSHFLRDVVGEEKAGRGKKMGFFFKKTVDSRASDNFLFFLPMMMLQQVHT